MTVRQSFLAFFIDFLQFHPPCNLRFEVLHFYSFIFAVKIPKMDLIVRFFDGRTANYKNCMKFLLSFIIVK